MIKKICTRAWFPLVILFSISVLPIIEYIKFSIGNDEFNYILMLTILFVSIIGFLHYSKFSINYKIGSTTIYISLFFLILGYSSLPHRQYERAQSHYQQFEHLDISSVKKDELYNERIKYLLSEQKACKLELEAQEIRYKGSELFYNNETWIYVLFLTSIALSFTYGICWFRYQNGKPDKRFKKVN
jgi:hypothetical protein